MTNKPNHPTKPNTEKTEAERANRDPITGAPGAHPVGVGVGAGGGAVAGAAVGAVVGGPIGAAVGGAIGAVAGGLAGKGTAESFDPTIEDAYWRKNFPSRFYYVDGVRFEDYLPAYRHGYASVQKHHGKTWSQAEADIEANWYKAKDSSTLTWDNAKFAVKDSWERLTTTKK
jgi:hypothetical protein